MIATSRRKGTRIVLQSWLSNNKAVNRRIDLHPAYQALRHSSKKIKPTRRLTENQVMSARQQIAAVTSGNSNSYSVIDDTPTSAVSTGQRQATYAEHRAHNIIAVLDDVRSAVGKLASKKTLLGERLVFNSITRGTDIQDKPTVHSGLIFVAECTRSNRIQSADLV